jgi:hypothetical protein
MFPLLVGVEAIFTGYYEQEADELSTGQMLHLPSS